MIIRIEKAKWRREGVACLFDGTKFDLAGFLGLAYGFTAEEMLGRDNLLRVRNNYPKEMEWLNDEVKWFNGQVFRSVITFMWYLDTMGKKDWIEKFFGAAKIKVEWV